MKPCQKLVPRFLRVVVELRQSGLAQLATLGDTLYSWSEEIARMWRFTRSNGITEGFHNKMETISRQAYGFRIPKTTGNECRCSVLDWSWDLGCPRFWRTASPLSNLVVYLLCTRCFERKP